MKAFCGVISGKIAIVFPNNYSENSQETLKERGKGLL